MSADINSEKEEKSQEELVFSPLYPEDKRPEDESKKKHIEGEVLGNHRLTPESVRKSKNEWPRQKASNCKHVLFFGLFLLNDRDKY